MPRTTWYDFEDGTYALVSGANIGVIVHKDSALMVDAGLDADSARRALRQLDRIGVPLSALIITHGHADHFGGAGWIVAQTRVPVFAPPLESAYVEFPLLEPLFLNGGAAPITELRSKFTLAREGAGPTRPLTPGLMEIAGVPIEVIALPGHAPNQMGIGYPVGGGTLYCGDAIFPQATLDRHPILFCADMDAWLETLSRLPTLNYSRFLPGHGEPITAADIRERATATANRLRDIRDLTLRALAQPRTPHEILQAVAAHYGATFNAPQFFLLSLTTIYAALTSLQQAGKAEPIMRGNQLFWRATQSSLASS